MSHRHSKDIMNTLIFTQSFSLSEMDSGFYVLKLLLKVKEYGVYVINTIKKRKYWPWGVYEGKISSHFPSSPVGTSYLNMGSYNSVDFKLICLNNQNMSPSICPPLHHSQYPILTGRNSVSYLTDKKLEAHCAIFLPQNGNTSF